MQLTTLTVSAGRTFNHPTERFANYRFDLHLTSNVMPGQDAFKFLSALQTQAEHAAETHKARILKACELQHQITMAKGCLESINRGWETFLDEAHKITRLDEIQARIGKLQAELAALGLLPAPDLHPGHPDHPDTGNDEP